MYFTNSLRMRSGINETCTYERTYVRALKLHGFTRIDRKTWLLINDAALKITVLPQALTPYRGYLLLALLLLLRFHVHRGDVPRKVGRERILRIAYNMCTHTYFCSYRSVVEKSMYVSRVTELSAPICSNNTVFKKNGRNS